MATFFKQEHILRLPRFDRHGKARQTNRIFFVQEGGVRLQNLQQKI